MALLAVNCGCSVQLVSKQCGVSVGRSSSHLQTKTGQGSLADTLESFGALQLAVLLGVVD